MCFVIQKLIIKKMTMVSIDSLPLKLVDWINLEEKNQDKINWKCLSGNSNAIHLLEQNPDKINWRYSSKNPFVFEIDYQILQQRIEIFKEKIMLKCFHPDRLGRYLENYK